MTPPLFFESVLPERKNLYFEIVSCDSSLFRSSFSAMCVSCRHRTSALASTAAVMAHCIELILIFALCSAVGTIVALLYRLRICESCLGLPAKE